MGRCRGFVRVVRRILRMDLGLCVRFPPYLLYHGELMKRSDETVRAYNLQTLRQQIHDTPRYSGSTCFERRTGAYSLATWEDFMLCL